MSNVDKVENMHVARELPIECSLLRTLSSNITIKYFEMLLYNRVYSALLRYCLAEMNMMYCKRTCLNIRTCARIRSTSTLGRTVVSCIVEYPTILFLIVMRAAKKKEII